MKVKLHFLTLALLCLTACSSGSGGAQWYLADKQSSLLAKGNPPSYVDGYVDGCASGKRMGGDKRFTYKRDEIRAEKEALYARGWQEGQITCRNEALVDEQNRLRESRPMSSIDEERQRRVAAESRAAEAQMQEIWDELKK